MSAALSLDDILRICVGFCLADRIAGKFPEILMMPKPPELAAFHPTPAWFHWVYLGSLGIRLQKWVIFQTKIHDIWGFPEIGIPLVIVHIDGIFPNKNHLFWSILGYPHDYGTSHILTWSAPGSADIPELSHRIPAESGTTISLRALKGEEAEWIEKGHGMMMNDVHLKELGNYSRWKNMGYAQEGRETHEVFTLRWKPLRNHMVRMSRTEGFRHLQHLWSDPPWKCVCTRTICLGQTIVPASFLSSKFSQVISTLQSSEMSVLLRLALAQDKRSLFRI